MTAEPSRAQCDADQSPVIVGRIAGSHGVRGWVKVESFTRPAQEILQYRRWLLAQQRDADDWRAVQVALTRGQPKSLLAKLDGIDARDDSDALRGQWIAVRRAQLARLAPGEYYWSDLIGLAVINQDGVELGVVDHLLETGANDVLVVRGRDAADEAGAPEHLLPWSPQAIVAVDLGSGCLRVRWDALA
ncbi:MAG: ribosome maturation factor RimM [bacterium]